MRKLREYIFEHPRYRQSIAFLKSVHIGRTQKVSIYTFLQILFKKIIKDNLNGKAMSVAFSLTLSIFPFILFILTLLPYTPINKGQILEFIAEAIPGGIFDFINDTVNDILSHKRQELLSFSVIFALYAATNGMATLIVSFNSTYRLAEKRSFLRLRLVALLLTMIVAFVLFVAIAVLIVGNILLGWLSKEGWINSDLLYWSIVLLKYFTVFTVFFLAVGFIYYIAPASRRKWRFFSLGSISASALIILSTNAFSFYLNNFAAYNKLYGSIGTLIALMIWIYLVSFILLLGLEMNACLIEAKRVHAQQIAQRDGSILRKEL